MDIPIHKARSEQSALLGKRECVSVSASVATDLGVNTGAQVRLRHLGTGQMGAFTIKSIHADSTVPLRIAKRGRTQLNAAPGDRVTIRSTVPNTQKSFHEAWRTDDCVETVWHTEQADPAVAFIAPHGGDSEQNTDESAVYAAKAYPNAASLWAVHNFGPQATERWHITSTAIAPVSYPGLQRIRGTNFERVVSFHLWNGDEIIVGGLASSAYRTALADRIRDGVNGVRDVVTEDAKYMGESETNVVNWLTDGHTGGIQIEAPAYVYQRYRKRLGETVAEYVADRIDESGTSR